MVIYRVIGTLSNSGGPQFASENRSHCFHHKISIIYK